MKVFVVYVVMLTSRAWINYSLWTCRLSSHNSSPSIETSLVLMIYLPWRRSAISGYEALSLQCKNRNILPKNRHFPLILFFFWTLPDNKPNGIKALLLSIFFKILFTRHRTLVYGAVLLQSSVYSLFLSFCAHYLVLIVCMFIWQFLPRLQINYRQFLLNIVFFSFVFYFIPFRDCRHDVLFVCSKVYCCGFVHDHIYNVTSNSKSPRKLLHIKIPTSYLYN